MAMHIKWEGYCCESCVLLCANGECGTAEESDRQNQLMIDHLGADIAHMVLTGNEADTEGDFMWRRCEACNDSAGGQRWPFAILAPGPGDRPAEEE